MSEPEALRHQRRLEQHAKIRSRGWQKTAYQKEAYDGHESEEEA